jgi:hypothetical protein
MPFLPRAQLRSSVAPAPMLVSVAAEKQLLCGSHKSRGDREKLQVSTKGMEMLEVLTTGMPIGTSSQRRDKPVGIQPRTSHLRRSLPQQPSNQCLACDSVLFGLTQLPRALPPNIPPSRSPLLLAAYSATPLSPPP